MKASSLVARARLRLRSWGATREDKIDYWRNRLQADYHEHTWSPEQIAKSQRIATAFDNECGDATSLHELGVGAGRNISHLLKRRPDVSYAGNDLSWADCSRFMQPEVTEALEFVELDTVTFLQEAVASGASVDAVLVADHLIHIPPDSIDAILAFLRQYARKYIVFHEGVRRRPDRADDFWWAHDYASLEADFEIVHEEQPPEEVFEEYVLRVYRRH
jgi:SAM-dependent methyltransferase